MATEKYYTPTIDEFHVGFEYYFRSAYQEGVSATEVVIDGIDGYEPETFNFEVWNYSRSKGESWKGMFENMMEHNQVKVKYLDKEDIESLGFKYIIKGSRIIANKPKLIGNVEYGQWIIKYDQDKHKIQIESISTDNNTIYWLQNVTINNKSELKVLLKQLNIND
jgi:hypothetical protein